jgi:hypothetical protein
VSTASNRCLISFLVLMIESCSFVRDASNSSRLIVSVFSALNGRMGIHWMISANSLSSRAIVSLSSYDSSSGAAVSVRPDDRKGKEWTHEALLSVLPSGCPDTFVNPAVPASHTLVYSISFTYLDFKGLTYAYSAHLLISSLTLSRSYSIVLRSTSTASNLALSSAVPDLAALTDICAFRCIDRI